MNYRLSPAFASVVQECVPSATVPGWEGKRGCIVPGGDLGWGDGGRRAEFVADGSSTHWEGQTQSSERSHVSQLGAWPRGHHTGHTQLRLVLGSQAQILPPSNLFDDPCETVSQGMDKSTSKCVVIENTKYARCECEEISYTILQVKMYQDKIHIFCIFRNIIQWDMHKISSVPSADEGNVSILVDVS